MAERVQISHYYTTGNTWPDSRKLTYGELALSISAGSESIFVKNTDNKITRFSTESQFLGQNNTFNGNITFNKKTTFNSGATFNKAITVASGLTFTNTGKNIVAPDGLNITTITSKPINITAPIYITGTTTNVSATTFSIIGATSIKGNTNFNGNATISGTTNLKGNTYISASTFNITGTTKFNGITNINGNTAISGITTLSGNTFITGTCTSTGGFFDTSDERLKNFENEINVNLDDIKNIKKTYFYYKHDNEKEKHIGVSAQDIEKIYPEITNTNSDGYLTVDYSKLSVIALKAVDVLHEENTNLKLKLIDLEKRLNKLENK